MDIYEKMMLIKNADYMENAKELTYKIDRIVFGYTRIYEPKSDSRSGVLVPAWDFFGSYEGYTRIYEPKSDSRSGVLVPAWDFFGSYEGTYKEGAEWETGSENFLYAPQYESYLTINAIDGSVIDRGLGY